MPMQIIRNDLTKMQVDATASAARFGIGADRAANYHADHQGTLRNYEAVNDAVGNLRDLQRDKE